MGFSVIDEQSLRHPREQKTAYPRRDFVESGMRYYSSILARWINRDPIGENGGRNLYLFLDNGPITHIDFLGAVAWSTFLKCAIEASLGNVFNILDGLDEFVTEVNVARLLTKDCQASADEHRSGRPAHRGCPTVMKAVKVEGPKPFKLFATCMAKAAAGNKLPDWLKPAVDAVPNEETSVELSLKIKACYRCIPGGGMKWWAITEMKATGHSDGVNIGEISREVVAGPKLRGIIERDKNAWVGCCSDCHYDN